MTLSLLLNNGKLALAGSGKLPQSSSCCCDTPCFCPDLCRYRICVVEPSEIAVCSQYVGCGSGNPGASYAPPTTYPLYPCLYPLTLDGWAQEGFCDDLCYGGDDCDPNDPFYYEPNTTITNSAGSRSSADRQEASVSHTQYFLKCPGCAEGYDLTITLSLVCTAGGWFAGVEFRADFMGSGFIKRTGSISLPSACESCRGDSGNCDTPPANCNALQTPLTITANGQTTSLGEYTFIDDVEITDFDQNNPCDPELVYLAMREHVLGASATFRIESRNTCEQVCCCGDDGTIIETDQNEPCSGQIVSKPAETCNWDDVTITFTVCGVSATASASDWADGIEPAFTAGQGNGNGDATGTCLRRDNGYGQAFTFNRFTFNTAGVLSCACNLRSIGLSISVDYIDDVDPSNAKVATCYYDLSINECLNELVLAENTSLPDGPCCPDACVIECEVNWAP